MDKYEKFAIKEALICILKLLEPMEFNDFENQKRLRMKYIESTIKLIEETERKKK